MTERFRQRDVSRDSEAKSAGIYHHDLMGHNYDIIQIVTIEEIVEANKRLDIPMSLEVVKAAKKKFDDAQIKMFE